MPIWIPMLLGAAAGGALGGTVLKPKGRKWHEGAAVGAAIGGLGGASLGASAAPAATGTAATTSSPVIAGGGTVLAPGAAAPVGTGTVLAPTAGTISSAEGGLAAAMTPSLAPATTAASPMGIGGYAQNALAGTGNFIKNNKAVSAFVGLGAADAILPPKYEEDNESMRASDVGTASWNEPAEEDSERRRIFRGGVSDYNYTGGVGVRNNFSRMFT